MFTRRVLLTAMLAGVAAERKPLLWGFDLDWSQLNEKHVDTLAALWWPLGAPLVVFPGLSGVMRPLDLLVRFLKQTQATPLLFLGTNQNPSELIQPLLAQGYIPYVVLSQPSEVAQVEKLLPKDHIAVLGSSTGENTIAYLPQIIPVQSTSPSAQKRELVLALRPLLQNPSWFLGIEPTPGNPTLQMTALTWLLGQPQVNLALAGNFLQLLDRDLRPTATYAWWRSRRAEIK